MPFNRSIGGLIVLGVTVGCGGLLAPVDDDAEPEPESRGATAMITLSTHALSGSAHAVGLEVRASLSSRALADRFVDEGLQIGPCAIVSRSAPAPQDGAKVEVGGIAASKSVDFLWDARTPRVPEVRVDDYATWSTSPDVAFVDRSIVGGIDRDPLAAGLTVCVHGSATGGVLPAFEACLPTPAVMPDGPIVADRDLVLGLGDWAHDREAALEIGLGGATRVARCEYSRVKDRAIVPRDVIRALTDDGASAISLSYIGTTRMLEREGKRVRLQLARGRPFGVGIAHGPGR